MPPTHGYKYPLPSNSFGLGKLPPIRRKMDRPICVGRVWIFLILGVVLFVLGLVSVGVYFNLDTITSSREYIEVMPPLVNIVAILLSGLAVCSLFWKRLKIMVLLVVVVCIASGLLCGATAVLNMTHILQPIQSFSNCRYYLSQKLCQCFSPYARDLLSLDFSETDLTKYDFKDAASCTSIQDVLPQLLYTLIAVYSVVLVVCFGSAVVALLVLRIETNKRNCFQDENYEEVYTVSGSSIHDQSDDEPDIVTANQDQDIIQGIPSHRGSNTDTINSNRSVVPSINSNRSGPQAQNIGRISASSQSSLQNTNSLKSHLTPRSKTPGLNDLGKESLANRYKINKTPDREIAFRHRVSKTPDREVGSRRRNSLNLTKRLSKSCDSLESSGKESSEQLEFESGIVGKKGKGRLKEHRRKGKRAATVHTLDRDQLLLILSLQMRYLQESQEKELKRNSQIGVTSRRAITPQPSSQKQVIPPKVRSHTPQPYRLNYQQEKDSKEKEFYDQIETLLFRSKQKEQLRLNQNQSRWDTPTRKPSDTTEQNNNNINVNSASVKQNQTVNDKDKVVSRQEGLQSNSESYLTSQQIYRTTPTSKSSYVPYSGPSYNSADSVHYLTYNDNMLRKLPKQPLQSRQSVRNSSLPPEPLHRGRSNHPLPPKPISRQQFVNQPLPPQPIHRGQSEVTQRGHSAFQRVDRSSKSRSPSVASDLDNGVSMATGRTGMRKDQADVAIRENFQMNPSPYMLQNTKDTGRNPNRDLQFTVNENVKMLTRGNQNQTPPPDILPPYSGPPSYHEYVSSCDHSVTSSLSSNPDDIYSMPKRRVSPGEQTDRILTNQNAQPSVSTNQNGFGNSNFQEIEHVYGNAETFQQISNQNRHKGQGQIQGQVQGQRCLDMNDYNAQYSSPSRSRVKQFIVPEDYYTPIYQIQKQKEKNKHQNNDAFQQNPRNCSLKQAAVTGFSLKSDDKQFLNGQSSRHDPFYGNLGDSTFHGYRESSGHHQIGPDAKYHEYEDVYETVSPPTAYSNTPKISGPSDRQAYPYQTASLTNHGFETPNWRGKHTKKSRDKSPMKPKSSYPVSNVNTRILDFTQPMGSGVSDHLIPSVQNVHAGNLRNIPKIKLNSEETEDDDDVFTDGDHYGNNFDLLRGQGQGVSKQQGQDGQNNQGRSVTKPQGQGNYNDQRTIKQNKSDHAGMLNSQDKTRTNEEAIQGDNLVSDSGYMKMTLPVTSQQQRIGDADEAKTKLSNQTLDNQPMSGRFQRANENESQNHVTGSAYVMVGHMTGSGSGSRSHVTRNDQSNERPDVMVGHVTGSGSGSRSQVTINDQSDERSDMTVEESGSGQRQMPEGTEGDNGSVAGSECEETGV